MNKLIKVYFPSISISFFIVLMCISIKDILTSPKPEAYSYFMIQFAVYLCLSIPLDVLLRNINFKTFFAHFISETILLYPITLVFAWFGNWFHITNLKSLILGTLFYLIIMNIIHLYSYFSLNQEVNDLNNLITHKKTN